MKRLGVALSVCVLGFGVSSCDTTAPLVEPTPYAPVVDRTAAPDTTRDGGVNTLDGGSGYGSGHRTCDSITPC